MAQTENISRKNSRRLLSSINLTMMLLITAEKDPSPPYEALSYAWRDSKNLTSLRINNDRHCCMMVSESLSAVLLHLVLKVG